MEPGDDCIVKLTFTPTDSGERNASLEAAYGEGDAVDVGLTGEGVAPTCYGQTATIVGTPGPDVIDGTPWHDIVVLMGGDDIFREGLVDPPWSSSSPEPPRRPSRAGPPRRTSSPPPPQTRSDEPLSYSPDA